MPTAPMTPTTYRPWVPPNYEEHARGSAAKARARVITAQQNHNERLRALRGGGSPTIASPTLRSHAEAVDSLTAVVKAAATIRVERDNGLVEAAEVQGATLNLQRAACVLASLLGVEASQPLKADMTNDTGRIVSLKAVTESINSTRSVVMSAIEALAVFETNQKSSLFRLGMLKSALSDPEPESSTIRELAAGDPEAYHSAMSIVQGPDGPSIKGKERETELSGIGSGEV
jgi:hypothetical protein